MEDYKVLLFKLKSGEEFIAQVTNSESAGRAYQFDHPVVVGQNSESGKAHFIPWISMSKCQTGFSLDMDDIMFTRDVPDALVGAHKETYSGSRIVVPAMSIVQP